ncbi:MAG: hypothetical protein HUN05_12410 [Desulfobacter sp.]|nr:MAG: hypothetical protein HUN05_12410 [Desulfobacter sp.]
MAESFEYQEKLKRCEKANTAFYGAVKSKNEVYFQMASMFKEVTKDKKKSSVKWMDQILKSSNIPGKIFMDNI